MLVAASTLCLLWPTVLSGQADVGQQVADFEFPTFLQNGDGRTKLSEFRGSVVLVDFWGTR